MPIFHNVRLSPLSVKSSAVIINHWNSFFKGCTSALFCRISFNMLFGFEETSASHSFCSVLFFLKSQGSSTGFYLFFQICSAVLTFKSHFSASLSRIDCTPPWKPIWFYCAFSGHGFAFAFSLQRVLHRGAGAEQSVLPKPEPSA